MLPLTQWNADSDAKFLLRRVWAFDLDDTLTHEGDLPATIVAQLERLQQLGHRVVMVTGRPSSWAQPFAKILPFDAIVAENGSSMCFWPAGKRERRRGDEPKSLFWTPGGYVGHRDFLRTRGDSQAQKELVQREVFKAFPDMTLASDQMYRLFDVAIDFAESVQPPRPLSEAQKVKEIFEAHGAVAKVSSIHVNGWWGSFDKSQGLTTLFDQVSWNLGLADVVYFGDSPNDAPLFALAPVSVGVANLRAFSADLSWPRPSFITHAESSAGVLEAIHHYLNSGQGTP